MPDDGWLLNPATRRQLDSFRRRPAHALLLVGPPGAGKKYTARRLAAVLLDIPSEHLPRCPYFITVSKPEDKSEIPIESARDLIKKMSLKVPGAAGGIRRAAIIEDAGLLSREAQNALLKLLEEPPEGSVIFLTVVSPGDILPTIVSRTQRINILPAELSASLDYFGAKYAAAAIESQWRLARGAAGLLSALLSQDARHPLKLAVAQAKEFLSLDTYNRLIYLQPLSKNKAELKTFLEALAKVLAALQESNAAGPAPNTLKITKARAAVNNSLNSLGRNTSPRLLALDLALTMPL